MYHLHHTTFTTTALTQTAALNNEIQLILKNIAFYIYICTYIYLDIYTYISSNKT